jgi:glycosyltransferase involved in cell wall biosynthesis
VAAIAEALRSILRLEPADMAALRQRCFRAAVERWNWEHESEALVGLYADIVPVAQAGSRLSPSR